MMACCSVEVPLYHSFQSWIPDSLVPTTGKTSFAQSRDFCREQKRGISAKKPFAERGSRQTRAIGNSQDCRGPASRQTTTLGEVGHFAESPARQKMTFGKMGLCRGPHSRQNQALGKTLPWAHRRDLPWRRHHFAESPTVMALGKTVCRALLSANICREPLPGSRQTWFLYFMCMCFSSPNSLQLNCFFFHMLQTFFLYTHTTGCTQY